MVNRFVKCLNNMINWPNNLVNYIGIRAVSQSTGPVGHTLNYIRDRYNIKWNQIKSCFNIININNYLDMTKDVISKTVKELCNVRVGVLYIENFMALNLALRLLVRMKYNAKLNCVQIIRCHCFSYHVNCWIRRCCTSLPRPKYTGSTGSDFLHPHEPLVSVAALHFRHFHQAYCFWLYICYLIQSMQL